MPSLLASPVAASPLQGHAFKTAYPMHTIAMKALMELTELLPHQEAKQRGILTKHKSEHAGKVIGISHQWLSHTSPDPKGEHLQSLQGLLKRFMEGKWSSLEFFWLYHSALNCKAQKFNWKAALPEMFVWLDYLSMPQSNYGEDQVHAQDAALAVRSIPAYMERCSLLIVLAPPCRHQDTGSVCNYGTWRRRGWCRAELLACTCAAQDVPLVVCTGVNAQPFLIHQCDAARLNVGAGEFTCCQLNHTFQGRKLECDKVKVQMVLRTMLRAKVQLLGLQGRWESQRYWGQLQTTVLKDLPSASDELPLDVDPTLAKLLKAQQQREEQIAASASPDEALAQRLDWGEKDEAMAKKTGISLLFCAALANDVAAIKHLVEGPRKLDVNGQLTDTFGNLAYMHKGSTPVMVAMGMSDTETVQALLEARADPYRISGKALNPLMIAACRGKLDNASLWMKRFPDWDLEQLGFDMAIPAVAIACLAGTEKDKMLSFLFQAGAKVVRPNVWGRDGLMLALISLNEDSDEKALRTLLSHGCDPNAPWRPNNLQWSLTMKAISTFSRCSQSRMLMEFALLSGSTPLHFAAKRGDVEFVRILTEAGAVSKRNAAGHTPLDVARRFFGDHVPQLLEDALLPSMAGAAAMSVPPTLLASHAVVAATSTHNMKSQGVPADANAVVAAVSTHSIKSHVEPADADNAVVAVLSTHGMKSQGAPVDAAETQQVV